MCSVTILNVMIPYFYNSTRNNSHSWYASNLINSNLVQMNQPAPDSSWKFNVDITFHIIALSLDLQFPQARVVLSWMRVLTPIMFDPQKLNPLHALWTCRSAITSAGAQLAMTQALKPRQCEPLRLRAPISASRIVISHISTSCLLFLVMPG